MNTLLEFDSVTKDYALGKTKVSALRGASLQIARGSFTAIVGASGSGKSTLLKIAGALETPCSGRCLFDGQDLAALTETARSRLRNQHMGFIFQSFNLVPVLDVYENVELPLLINRRLPGNERHDRIVQAIADVGLEARLRHRPDALSGGERQRVAIARALAGAPELVLADEPTANLDSKNAHRVIDLMQALSEKHSVTFLFSTHDLQLIKRVRTVHTLQDGKVHT